MGKGKKTFLIDWHRLHPTGASQGKRWEDRELELPFGGLPVPWRLCPLLLARIYSLHCGCFGTVVLEKTLESPSGCKEIQPVHIKEISPEYALEGGLMLKLKLQYFGYLIRRTDSFGKDPDAGKDWRQEEKGMTGWDDWMASPTQWTWVWADSRRRWKTGRPGMLQFMETQRVRHDWVTEQQ